MKELLKLANTDYQKRGSEYPKSLIPDIIEVTINGESVTVSFDFKNTSNSEALVWYEKSKECKVINKFKDDYDIAISTSQDGDFKDDWQKLTVLLTKKDIITITTEEAKTKKLPNTTSKVESTISDNISYTYTYVLSTVEQRKAINLIKYKSQLEKIIKNFFNERLKSVTFNKESYTLSLNEEYLVSDKRRLGRLISDGTNLKQYVNKIIYNGNQDVSGQLFRFKQDTAEVEDDAKI